MLVGEGTASYERTCLLTHTPEVGEKVAHLQRTECLCPPHTNWPRQRSLGALFMCLGAHRRLTPRDCVYSVTADLPSRNSQVVGAISARNPEIMPCRCINCCCSVASLSSNAGPPPLTPATGADAAGPPPAPPGPRRCCCAACTAAAASCTRCCCCWCAGVWPAAAGCCWLGPNLSPLLPPPAA